MFVISLHHQGWGYWINFLFIFRFFTTVNSLAPARPRCHFKTAIIHLILLIGIFTSSKDNVLRWMPRDLTDYKSTLVQVMAWCCQATRHYLSQCWPCSMASPGHNEFKSWIPTEYHIHTWHSYLSNMNVVQSISLVLLHDRKLPWWRN